MEPTPEIRVDKWLWSARLCKTRSVATEACQAGKVQVNGHPCKPARHVRPGDIIVVGVGEVTRTVKLLSVVERRVGAKQVSQILEDLTPPAEYEKARLNRAGPVGHRPKGSGRPTKKERRILGSFFGLEE